MKIAVPLAGTDRGRSGLGRWVRSVIPRLISRLEARGDSLVAIGTGADLEAYQATLRGAETLELPWTLDAPIVSALWHLSRASSVAIDAGASAILSPCANRRLVIGGGCPHIAVVHDVATATDPDRYGGVRAAYVKHAVTASLRRADRLVAVSRTTASALRTLLVLDARTPIHVVPNGVDADRFRPLEEASPAIAEARAKHAIVGRYLLYVARLEHPAKNHLRLLEAFAACDAARDHKLLFVGPDWGARAAIDAHITRLGLEGRARVLGEVDEAHLPALVAGADAATVVGLCEGFGLPVLEAFACGRPVVVANAGALPEVAGDLGVVCDGRDVASMSAAIARALTDETLRARAAIEGPAHARRQDWDTAAARLLEFADDAIAERTGARAPVTIAQQTRPIHVA